MKVAVIVGRFQAPYLHSGHQKLIYTAFQQCERVIIFIGSSIVRGDRNPLPYELIRRGVQNLHGSVEVHQLRDEKIDNVWLDSLFGKVKDLTDSADEILYYGSRDSFLTSLPEDKNTVNVEAVEGDLSATKLRNSVHYRDNRWFFEGYIKAVQDEFPAHYAVVDAVITDGVNVLLGHKKSGYCIIGGFADSCDKSLEDAIIREVKEETNLDVSNPEYLMSAQLKDWRYKNARQPFTSVFVLKVENFENVKAQDDIDEIKIVPLTEAENYLPVNGTHITIIKKYLDVRNKRFQERK